MLFLSAQSEIYIYNLYCVSKFIYFNHIYFIFIIFLMLSKNYLFHIFTLFFFQLLPPSLWLFKNPCFILYL